MQSVVHWDDVPASRREAGHIAGSWRDLGIPAGSVRVGVRRIELEPGAWSTPAHVHGAEEEIFYVLGGSGLSWQDGQTFEVRAGDVLVHLAMGPAHTLLAGPQGLDVLAFGQRIPETATHLPRAGASWLRPSWVLAGGADNHPFAREAVAGPPEVPDPSPRPPSIVAIEDAERSEGGHGSCAWVIRDAGRSVGSVHTGLRRYDVPPGKLGAPPHCHSAEEELFVVLDGDGSLLLGGDGDGPDGWRYDEHAVRAGSVVSRPPGTRVAHAFRAGHAGLSLLAFSDRQPNDIAYYPRSGKVSIRGVGVIGRIERADYWDGEE